MDSPYPGAFIQPHSAGGFSMFKHHIQDSALFRLSRCCLRKCMLVISLFSILRFQVCIAGIETRGVHFPLKHKYAHLAGSSHSGTEERGGVMSWDHFLILRKHDRERHTVVHRRAAGRLLAEESSLAATGTSYNRFDEVSRQRQGRSVAEKGAGADMELQGNADQQVAGLYWTTIGLGTPPVNYSVQVDTGSDLLWVQCQPCISCATSSDLLGSLAPPYDPSKSETSSILSCRDAVCKDFQRSSSALETGCSTENSSDTRCIYKLRYGDGSNTTGNLVTDNMEFTSLAGNATSSKMTFGCGYLQAGPLVSTPRVVDGLMGLGMGTFSVPSQLTGQGVIANTFAHCLGGEATGEGTLVLGTVVADGAVFTPMPDSQGRPQYYVTLKSISIGSTQLQGISASDFGTPAEYGGVIFDSGTTLAIVPDTVYYAFLDQLKSVVTNLDLLTIPEWQDEVCWQYNGKTLADLPKYFPNATLTFENATMDLEPQNYLTVLQITSSAQGACFSWQSASSTGITISLLGDVIMRNKLMIYDEGNQRMGWVEADCSNSAIRTQNVTLIVAYGSAGTSHDFSSIHLAWSFGLLLLSVLLLL